jgi:hypothetical protein
MVLTEWELTNISTSGLVLNKFGILKLEFFNRRTGAVEYFDAPLAALLTAFSPANSWIPGGIPIPGVPRHLGQVLAKSASFSISAIRGNYGVLFLQSGTSGSVATLSFSSQAPVLPYVFLYGMFAFTTFVGSPLIAMLSTGVYPFMVN